MKFNRTYTTLNNLDMKKDITILDTINIFRDICNDIKSETGYNISDLQIDDINTLITRITWLSRTILQIQRVNEEKFNIYGEKADRLKQVCDELEIASRDLNNIEEALNNSILKEKQLIRKRDALKLAKKQETDILNRCKNFENEISEYEKIHIAELQEKESLLSENLKTLKEDYDTKRVKCIELEKKIKFMKDSQDEQAKIIANKEKELSNNSIALSTLRGKCSILDNKLNDAHSDQNQLVQILNDKKEEIDKVNFNINNLQNEIANIVNIQIPDLKSKTEQLKIELSDNKEIYDTEFEILSNLKNELDELRSQKEILDNEVADKEIEKADIEKNINRLKNNWDNINQKIKTLGTEKQKLIEEIQLKNEQYNNSNVPTLREKLIKIEAQVKENQEETQSLEDTIIIKEQLLLENINKNKSYQFEIKELDEQNNKCGQEQKDLIFQKENAQIQKKDWEEWYNNTGKKYRDEINILSKYLSVLADASEKLCNSVNFKGLVGNDTMQKINDFKQCYKLEINFIADRLSKYQNSYNEIVRVIESRCMDI